MNKIGKTIIKLVAFAGLLISVAIASTANGITTNNEMASTAENRLEVTAFDYAFMAPDRVNSGWTHILVDNQRAEEVHEVTVVRLPDGVTYQQYLDEFIAPWMEIWEGMKAGDVTMDNLGEAMGSLPDWSTELDYRHARGLVSSGKQAEAWAHLPAGRYAVECWVKSEHGHVHIAHGMIRELIVEVEDGGAEPPAQGIALGISSDGIDAPEMLSTGSHTFIVNVDARDNGAPVYPDLHLIRVEDDTDPAAVVEWLDWYVVEGLTSPAPATFLGGYSTYGSALIDNKAYFTAHINEPGDYAWVIQSDPDNPVWRQFTVE